MLCHHRLTLCYPRICAMGVWSATPLTSLNIEQEFLLLLSGPVLYLSSRSLFDAILSSSQSLISGLPHPSDAREHPTYPFSGRLRLLCPHNDKAHVKTVNGESNPNPQNSLSSKTTSMHKAVCHGCVCKEKHNTISFLDIVLVAYPRTMKKKYLTVHLQ